MRKGALLLALAFAVGLTAPASAAKKKQMVDPAAQAQKDSWAFFNDAMHPWAPTAAAPKGTAPKARHKKKKS